MAAVDFQSDPDQSSGLEATLTLDAIQGSANLKRKQLLKVSTGLHDDFEDSCSTVYSSNMTKKTGPSGPVSLSSTGRVTTLNNI